MKPTDAAGEGAPLGGSPNPPPRVHRLREEVARKIAAGEVIDRPASVVRELLDNSLDAGAREITVRLDRGGLGRIEVSDDGSGIAAADLELCALPHTTSKITDEQDLERISSLGFRGEALASIGACARLEVISRTDGQGSAFRLVVEGGRRRAPESCPGRRGTLVSVSDLFFNMPARRKFMKAASAESALCRAVFEERALAFAEVAFRLFVSGELKAFYPAAAPLERARAVLARSLEHASLLEEVAAQGDGFSLRLILGAPEAARRDRRLVQIFVNRRRVQEYALVQAVEYGYTGTVPGGLHPVAFVFARIEPQLVDFNVHPAKREARIRILPEIHRAVVASVQGFLPRYARRAASVPPSAGLPFAPERPTPPGERLRERFVEAVSRAAASGPPPAASTHEAALPRYLGRVFGLFLVVEWGATLYLIDQHAAHERILMDRMLARQKHRQELLLPICFEATADEARVLRERSALLERLAIGLEQSGPGTFEVTGLPPEFEAIEAGELVRFLKSFDRSPEILEREIHSLAACRAALKDGDPVDAVTASELAAAALALPDARCPHGRPLWAAISRDELLRLVGRVV